MAIIFVSPKKRQQQFAVIASFVVILVLLAVFLITFFDDIKHRFAYVPNTEIVSVPEVKVNFNVIDSPMVKNLELFEGIQLEFTYAAQDQAGKKSTGTVLAQSKDEAALKLQEQGLAVLDLQEVIAGRSEPFTSY